MKRLSFLIMAATMFATVGYSTNGEIITITTSAERVSFQLKGSGIAIVDWGDGSENQTVELELTDEYGWSRTMIRRINLDTNPRTIRIIGKNITGLKCTKEILLTENGSVLSNQFSELDVSQNPALVELHVGDNLLIELDVTLNHSLAILSCENNQLTKLDVSNNSALTHLRCQNNQLTDLDVSQNPALMLLMCGNNQLTILDVSRNPVLTRLLCDENQLTTMDVSKNPSLLELWLQNNQLTGLDVSQNTVLGFLFCMNNQLTTESLNLLFDTLHENIVTFESKDEGEQIIQKVIDISDNPGYDDCEQSIFEKKGWKTSF